MEKIKILFPESHDPRIVEAMNILNTEGICDAKALADFDDHINIEILARQFIERRALRGKEISIEQAREAMENRLYRAATLLSLGVVDACISGSDSKTQDVIRAGVQGLGVERGKQLVSSYFLMRHNGQEFAFADCAVIENPNEEELANIAITTADNFHRITGKTPHVALLSHSTLGSADGPSVEKIRNALVIIRSARPDLAVDGELQFDAAFSAVVAERKAPNSPVAGSANVFIFPDLSSGNLGYKIAERIGGATATGPILQGTDKQFHDLSRGCSVSDIVDLAKITVKQHRTQE